MSKTAIDIASLSVSERIQLAEDLWDSVAVTDANIPLTPAQVDELDRRLDDLERNPDAGVPWEVARARLEERVRRGD
jgi:putative addiction module component (TIGR02574 family)